MASHLIIKGIVQGVGYRAWFLSQAQALRLRGWVRNRSDGSVEAVVCGAPQAVDEMIALARRGPPAARVRQLNAHPVPDDNVAEADFELRATA